VFEAVIVEADGVEHPARRLDGARRRVPGRGALVTVLGITPPSFEKSTNGAISFAYPNVPDAVRMGFRSVRRPSVTDRSISSASGLWFWFVTHTSTRTLLVHRRVRHAGFGEPLLAKLARVALPARPTLRVGS